MNATRPDDPSVLCYRTMMDLVTHSARTGIDEKEDSRTVLDAEALDDDFDQNDDVDEGDGDTLRAKCVEPSPEDPFLEAQEHLPAFSQPTSIHSIKQDEDLLKGLKWAVHCYWDASYKYDDIVKTLSSKHNVTTSTRGLKRLLKSWGFSHSDGHLGDVELRTKVAILDSSNGGRLGYRAMKQYLAQEGHRASERRVLEALSAHNPENAAARKSRRFKRRKYLSAGPNANWHADGNDKTKAWGFPIYSIVDGYSRKLLRSEILESNSDPVIIGRFFLDEVKKRRGFPHVLVVDPGTETVLMGQLQMLLHYSSDPTNDHWATSVRVTSSPRNQRVEQHHSQMIRGFLGNYVETFDKLVDDGHVNTMDKGTMLLLRLCFDEVFKNDLARWQRYWNNKNIRRQRGSQISGVQPNRAYNSPVAPAENKLHPVTEEQLQRCDLEIEKYAEARPGRRGFARERKRITRASLDHEHLPKLRELVSAATRALQDRTLQGAPKAAAVYRLAEQDYSRWRRQQAPREEPRPSLSASQQDDAR